MRRLLAIDPGRMTGWALFVDSKLDALGLLEMEPDLDSSSGFRDVLEYHRPDEAVIEIPRIYPIRKWKGDPNDLIKVAVIAGILMGVLFEHGATKIEEVAPHDWKGSRPKAVDGMLTRSKLLDAEDRKLLQVGEKIGSSRRHNLIDAVGLGLWKLERR